MTTSNRVGEDALWRSVEQTLENLVLPQLPEGFERDSARQLLGLCRYAVARGGSSDELRAAELAAALGRPEAAGGLPELLGAARDLLVAAVDSPQPGAEEVRKHLKTVLAEDIAEAAPLLETFSGHATMEVADDDVDVPERAALTEWFSSVLGAPATLAVSVMSGGHSRRMLNVRVTAGGQTHQLIARIEQGGMFGTDGTSEAEVMRAVAAAGFAAPAVRWVVADADVLGQPFFVMDRVPGSAVADSPEIINAYIRDLAALHRLDPAVAEPGLGPFPASPEAAIGAMLDHWLGIYRESVDAPIPLLEESAAWLRRNLRPTGPTCLVHGDPGPGNFLHEKGRITALTDWELAHYGDAAEDWTYFGAIRARRMHDVPTWRARFAEQAGVTLSDRDWLGWEAFNQFKGACVNLTALRIFGEGVSSTPNLLAIGTAVHLRFLDRLTDLVAQLR